MADPDVLHRDLAEALDRVHDAQHDAEDIEGSDWSGTGERASAIENAANAAASALGDLAKVLAEAVKAVPGGVS